MSEPYISREAWIQFRDTVLENHPFHSRIVLGTLALADPTFTDEKSAALAESLAWHHEAMREQYTLEGAGVDVVKVKTDALPIAFLQANLQTAKDIMHTVPSLRAVSGHLQSEGMDHVRDFLESYADKAMDGPKRFDTLTRYLYRSTGDAIDYCAIALHAMRKPGTSFEYTALNMMNTLDRERGRMNTEVLALMRRMSLTHEIPIGRRRLVTPILNAYTEWMALADTVAPWPLGQIQDVPEMEAPIEEEDIVGPLQETYTTQQAHYAELIKAYRPSHRKVEQVSSRAFITALLKASRTGSLPLPAHRSDSPATETQFIKQINRVLFGLQQQGRHQESATDQHFRALIPQEHVAYQALTKTQQQLRLAGTYATLPESFADDMQWINDSWHRLDYHVRAHWAEGSLVASAIQRAIASYQRAKQHLSQGPAGA